MGDRDANDNAWDLTSSDNLRVSDKQGDRRLASKSPVIIILCVTKNDERVSKNCVDEVLLGVPSVSKFINSKVIALQSEPDPFAYDFKWSES